MTRQKKDRIFGAAVLKYTFQQRRAEQSPQFREIYEGVLRDLGLTDEAVERYLAENREAIAAAVGGRGGTSSERDGALPEGAPTDDAPIDGAPPDGPGPARPAPPGDAPSGKAPAGAGPSGDGRPGKPRGGHRGRA